MIPFVLPLGKLHLFEEKVEVPLSENQEARSIWDAHNPVPRPESHRTARCVDVWSYDYAR